MDDIKKQRDQMSESLKKSIEDREKLTKEVEKILAE